MKKFILHLLLLAVTSLTSCALQHVTPNSNIITYNVDVNHTFKAMEIDAAVKVIYNQSAKTDVVIETPDNIAPLLSVTIDSDILKVKFKENTAIDGNCNVTIYASSPSIDDIELSSAATLDIKQGLDCDNSIDIDVSSAAFLTIDRLKAMSLDMKSSSSAQISIDKAEVKQMKIETSSASIVKIAGTAKYVNLEASSASQIEASNLKVEIGNCEASSAATINCNVADLKDKKSSSGSVNNKYKQ